MGIYGSSMFAAVQGRRSAALQVESTVFDNNQVLPWLENQCGGIVQSPPNIYSKAVCNRQIIRNATGYQNFSTLGVVIIIILCSALIILGWVIDTVFGFIQATYLRSHYAWLSWTSDGYLQWQRMALEGVGDDNRTGCTDSVSVTADLESASHTLETLDVEHPRLQKFDNASLSSGSLEPVPTVPTVREDPKPTISIVDRNPEHTTTVEVEPKPPQFRR